jgi:hypothetical protein
MFYLVSAHQVFDVMAERKEISNFQRFLVVLNLTLFGTQRWWWCAKLSWFVKFQKGHNLESDLMSLLCLMIIRN